jgi:hypothetical protein
MEMENKHHNLVPNTIGSNVRGTQLNSQPEDHLFLGLLRFFGSNGALKYATSTSKSLPTDHRNTISHFIPF